MNWQPLYRCDGANSKRQCGLAGVKDRSVRICEVFGVVPSRADVIVDVRDENVPGACDEDYVVFLGEVVDGAGDPGLPIRRAVGFLIPLQHVVADREVKYPHAKRAEVFHNLGKHLGEEAVFLQAVVIGNDFGRCDPHTPLVGRPGRNVDAVVSDDRRYTRSVTESALLTHSCKRWTTLATTIAC